MTIDQCVVLERLAIRRMASFFMSILTDVQQDGHLE